MSYYLVSCYKNWADEFNTHSYSVITQSELDSFLDKISKEGETHFQMSFGTNEGWGEYGKDETVADVWRKNFTIKEIPETDYNILKNYKFNGSAPDMDDLIELMDYPVEDD